MELKNPIVSKKQLSPHQLSKVEACASQENVLSFSSSEITFCSDVQYYHHIDYHNIIFHIMIMICNFLTYQYIATCVHVYTNPKQKQPAVKSVRPAMVISD